MPYRWYAQLDSISLGILVYYARRHWVISRGARLRATLPLRRGRASPAPAQCTVTQRASFEARKARVQTKGYLGTEAQN